MENAAPVFGEVRQANNFQVQNVTWGGFTIETIKSSKAPESAEFLPARVTRNGIVWWSFKVDHPEFRGMAFLREVDDELVIAVATRRELFFALPVKDLPSLKRVKDNFFGGRDLKLLIQLKELVAEDLGVDPHWTEREKAMLAALNKAKTEKRKAEQAAEEAEAEAKRAKAKEEREKRRHEIMGRKRLYVYTASGDRRYGVPVVGDEWTILLPDTFCVAVGSFDGDTGEVGAVTESFVTAKGKGRPDRKAVVAVSLEKPGAVGEKPAALESLETRVITIGGEPEEVIVAPDMDFVRKLRGNGLNGGSLVMAPEKGAPDKFTVYRLTDGEIQAVTTVRRVAG